MRAARVPHHGRTTRPGKAAKTGCDICESHDSVGPLVVPVIWEDETVVVKHLLGPMPVFLGHLVVETRRHAVRIDGTTDEEAAAAGRAARRAALALRAVFDVEFFHAAIINTGHEHFHEHVYPPIVGHQVTTAGLMLTPGRGHRTATRTPWSSCALACSRTSSDTCSHPWASVAIESSRD